MPGLGPPAYSSFARQADAADNFVIQVVAELGVVGLIFLVVLILLLFRILFRLPGKPELLLGYPVVAALVMGLVSQTPENAATVLPLAIIVGAIVVRELPLSRIAGSFQPRLAATFLALVLVTGFGYVANAEVRTAIRFSKASALAKMGQAAEAARHALKAAHGPIFDPRSRIESYTYVVVAGPAFWREHGLSESNLQDLYERSASASPGNSLLLDLQIKRLLSTPGLSIDLDELERLLSKLQRTVGRWGANSHVLEAALALQLGDTARSRKALETARGLLADPPDQNDQTNIQNIQAIAARLESLGSRDAGP